MRANKASRQVPLGHSSALRSKFNQWHQLTASSHTAASPFLLSKQISLLFYIYSSSGILEECPPSFCLRWCSLTYMYIVGYHGWYWLGVVVAIVWVASRRRPGGGVVGGDGHCWGSSDGCFLGFRVSMRDWTPRFTLVVTRRVTESEDGEEEEPARWEGGRATRHFWYRSWGRGPKC